MGRLATPDPLSAGEERGLAWKVYDNYWNNWGGLLSYEHDEHRPEQDVKMARLGMALCISALISAASVADQFMIYDVESGKEYGPFTYTNNADITIGGRPYEIRRINTVADELIKRMKTIMIPRLEFRQAHIRDVVAFMRDAAEAADPAREGVSIVLSMIHDHKPTEQSADSLAMHQDPWGDAVKPRPHAESPPTISLNLRRVSLYDAISIIAEVANLNYRIDERGIVFLDSKGKEIDSPVIFDKQQ